MIQKLVLLFTITSLWCTFFMDRVIASSVSAPRGNWTRAQASASFTFWFRDICAPRHHSAQVYSIIRRYYSHLWIIPDSKSSARFPSARSTLHLNFTVSFPTNTTLRTSVPKVSDWVRVTEFPLAEFLSVLRVVSAGNRAEFGTLFRQYDGATCYTCRNSPSTNMSRCHGHSKYMISQRNELNAVYYARLRLEGLLHPSRREIEPRAPVELLFVLKTVLSISRRLIQDCFNFIDVWRTLQQQQQKQQQQQQRQDQEILTKIPLPSLEQYMSHYESYVRSQCAIMNSCLPRFPHLCLYDKGDGHEIKKDNYKSDHGKDIDDDDDDMRVVGDVSSLVPNSKKEREKLLRHMLSLYVQESIFPFIVRLYSEPTREVKPLDLWIPHVIYNKTETYTVPDGSSIDSRLLITQRTPEEYPSISFTCHHLGTVFNGLASSCLLEKDILSINATKYKVNNSTSLHKDVVLSTTTIRAYWAQRFLFSISPGSKYSYEYSLLLDNVDGAHAMGTGTLQCFSIETVHDLIGAGSSSTNMNSSAVEHCTRLKGGHHVISHMAALIGPASAMSRALDESSGAVKKHRNESYSSILSDSGSTSSSNSGGDEGGTYAANLLNDEEGLYVHDLRDIKSFSSALNALQTNKQRSRTLNHADTQKCTSSSPQSSPHKSSQPHILIMGLGPGSLHMSLLSYFPCATVHSVEVSEGMYHASKLVGMTHDEDCPAAKLERKTHQMPGGTVDAEEVSVVQETSGDSDGESSSGEWVVHRLTNTIVVIDGSGAGDALLPGAQRLLMNAASSRTLLYESPNDDAQDDLHASKQISNDSATTATATATATAVSCRSTVIICDAWDYLSFIDSGWSVQRAELSLSPTNNIIPSIDEERRIADKPKMAPYFHVKKERITYDIIFFDVYDCTNEWNGEPESGVSTPFIQTASSISTLSTVRDNIHPDGGLAIFFLHRDSVAREYYQNITRVFGKDQVFLLLDSSNTIIAVAGRNAFYDASGGGDEHSHSHTVDTTGATDTTTSTEEFFEHPDLLPHPCSFANEFISTQKFSEWVIAYGKRHGLGSLLTHEGAYMLECGSLSKYYARTL